MNELTMYQAEELSAKQYYQFVRFARETQPYLPFKEVAFIKLTSIAAAFCTVVSQTGGTENETARTKELLQTFKNKYYHYGFKINDGLLTKDQYQALLPFRYPRFHRPCEGVLPYDPIEKIAFIRLWRSCYWYLRNNEQLDFFIEELRDISNMIQG